MSELVLDASVVLKWFGATGERHLEKARGLRAAFEGGTLLVLAPPLLRLEILNVAGRRWHWDEGALVGLAAGLDDLGFEYLEPDLGQIARWTAQGLTAYDAAYVALAEEEGIRLVTDDELVISVAGEVATALHTL